MMVALLFYSYASKRKAMSWERACVLEDQLSEEVAELLAQAPGAGPAGQGPSQFYRSGVPDYAHQLSRLAAGLKRPSGR